MKSRKIVLTDRDFDRLRATIRAARQGRQEHEQHLIDLERELQRAAVVPSPEVPADIVTMNSRVTVLADDEPPRTITVVYPEKADFDEGRISVLAPLGTALLGCRVGDVVKWTVPAGLRTLRITKLEYQPERVGDNDEGPSHPMAQGGAARRLASSA